MKLKVLSYAFKDIPLQSLNQLMHTHPNESPEFRQEIETDLVYLATIGLEDPVTPGVKDTVQLIRYGRILNEDDEFPPENLKSHANVRMITGDHKETAKAVAIEAGIITEAESNTPGLVMTGEEFLEELGEYTKTWDGNEW